MNIFDAAKYILRSVGGEISTMKLQKLCYYSQAWTLVWDDVELFPEDFLRWDNGPVCRELFEVHQGLFFIDSHVIDDNLLSGDMPDSGRRNIDQVIEDYGKYQGVDLSEMTHVERPWLETQKNHVISKELIKTYYSGLINGKEDKAGR